ncbi:MAG: hypothetical protein OEZ01_02985 [Candidatus Heimdallarchaeota archaeon]|nr:hypothetical protein [Candidatus Heimdallarchaeota archaeon]MDH5644942.1 hypothetical protein [Candidatus Heimdallarchaeota archaeon]
MHDSDKVIHQIGLMTMLCVVIWSIICSATLLLSSGGTTSWSINNQTQNDYTISNRGGIHDPILYNSTISFLDVSYEIIDGYRSTDKELVVYFRLQLEGEMIMANIVAELYRSNTDLFHSVDTSLQVNTGISDLHSITFSNIYEYDLYNLELSIFQDGSTIADNYYYSENIQMGVPYGVGYFDNIYTEIFDNNGDENGDSITVYFSPSITEGFGIAQVKMSVYYENAIIDQATEFYDVGDGFIHHTSMNSSEMSDYGVYYVRMELYLTDVYNPDDVWQSDLITLNPNGIDTNTITTPLENDRSNTMDLIFPGVVFSNTYVVLSLLCVVTILNISRRYNR